MNCVIVFILWMVVTAAVHLRCRIRVKGLDEVVARYGRKGILFLPNHPALIDPVILNTVLWGKFKPRSLVTEKQIRTTILKRIGWHEEDAAQDDVPEVALQRLAKGGLVALRTAEVTAPETGGPDKDNRPNLYVPYRWIGNGRAGGCCRPACIPRAHRRRSTSSRGLA